MRVAATGIWAAAGTIGLAHAQPLCQLDDLFLATTSFDSDPTDFKSRANDLAIADFDDDGRPDVVTAGLVSGQAIPVVSLLRGNGNGGFGLATSIDSFGTPGLALSSSVISTDLDDDGNMDLVVTDGGLGGVPFRLPTGDITVPVDGAVVAYGDGSGGFTNESTLVTGQEPWDVRSGDFDGDGVTDLAFSNGRVQIFNDQAIPVENLPVTVTIRFGDGEGDFRPTEVSFQSAGSDSQIIGRDLVVADFDNDGNDDVAVLTNDGPATPNFPNDTHLTLHLSNGNGTFAPPQTLSSRSDGGGTIRAADLDADGDVDIVKPNTSGDNIGQLLNNGDGTFAPETTISAPDANEVVPADLNGDGILDLAAPTLRDTVSIHLGNGDGTYQPAREFFTGDRSPAGLDATDLDGDGDLDLVTAQSFYGNVTVLLNDGSGRFANPALPVDHGGAGLAPISADFDADGRTDVLSGRTVLFGASDGLAGGGDRVDTGIPLTNEHRVAAIDVNGDGLPDIVGARDLPPARTEAQLEIFLNNGDRTFATSPITRTLQINQPRSITAADFNGDGIDDLAIAASGDTSFPFTDGSDVLVLINNADTTFAQSSTPTQGIFPFVIDAADFNGDGLIDIAVNGRATTGNTPTLEILENDGAGGFLQGDLVNPIGFGQGSFVITDTDNDSDPDLVSINNSGSDLAEGTFTVFRNDGSGEFEFFFSDIVDVATPVLEDLQPRAIDVGDFDGDGREDLAISISVRSGQSDDLVNDSIGPFNYIGILLNDGDGAFGDFGFNQPFRISTGGGATPGHMLVEDLTADGAPDIAFPGSGFVGLIENQCVADIPCPADLTGDDLVDANDFFAYLDLFAANDPAADINQDTFIDANDFFAYLTLFAAGCP